MKPLTIAIIEDHAGMNTGISLLLNACAEFSCSSYTNAEEALRHFAVAQPDVVLMDIHLPGMDGIACTEKIKLLYPDVQVLILTVFEENDKIFSAIRAGANGYLLKRSAAGQLVDAIHDMMNGGAPMSNEIARKVIDAFRGRSEGDATTNFGLSGRENQILDMLARGYPNKEIAEKLSLSPHTIRTHIYHIYEKLQVRNRVEALQKINRKDS